MYLDRGPCCAWTPMGCVRYTCIMTTTRDFRQIGRDAHAAGARRTPALDATVRDTIAGRPVGDPDTVRIFDEWLTGWDEAREAADPFKHPTVEELVDLDRDTGDAVIAGRPLVEFVPMVGRPQHHPHRIEDIIGYAVRVTVHDGKILHAGLPAQTRAGYERCGCTVETFDGCNLFGEARDLALKYRDLPGIWAVIDRLYGCGCRTDI